MDSESMSGVPKLDLSRYLSELSINGLEGRMLRMPSANGKKKEILLVYGHHASLERMFGFAKFLNRYGNVTVPDMPGFGGMDSFYKIGKKPTIDNIADYLATFIKLRYKKGPITIVGFSLGTAVVTRMLQKYPRLVDRVELCASAIGFTHKDDIAASRRKKALSKVATRILSWYLPSQLAKAWLRKPVIRYMYNNDSLKAHSKTETEERRKYRVEFEVWLWQNNDIRTHFFTLHEVLTMNLCNDKVALPMYNVVVGTDQYLDDHMVEQHMRVIFASYEKMLLAHATVHAPTILATAAEAGAYIPQKLRRMLGRPS